MSLETTVVNKITPVIAVGLWTAGAWRPFDPASLPAALLPTLRYTAQRAASWPEQSGSPLPHSRAPAAR
jgi:hypothetical protein